MTFSSFVSWLFCGLVVGLIARFVMPGRQTLSIPMTMVIGIAGAIVGGILFSLTWGAPAQPLSWSGNAWHGWLVSILGAVVLLWVYPFIYPRSWWT
jgi:uncharacterized membrane protein YeaQ/YmgE (transglycosylase-associated protein family)